jgi:hypothetical protein
MRHKRFGLTTLAILCAALLGGCYDLPPDMAEILVGTTPPGASCTLSRAGQQIAIADPTPAIALVPPSNDAVTILCRRRGFQDAAATVVANGPAQGLPGLPGFNLLLGPPPPDYQHRVEIALVPG